MLPELLFDVTRILASFLFEATYLTNYGEHIGADAGLNRCPCCHADDCWLCPGHVIEIAGHDTDSILNDCHGLQSQSGWRGILAADSFMFT